MCGLMGSFDLFKLLELYNINKAAGRGTVGYSVSVVTKEMEFHLLKSGIKEEFTEDTIAFMNEEYEDENITEMGYFILHSLAPTSKTLNLHPAIDTDSGSALWHNGVLKASTVARLEKKYELYRGWDTELLLQVIQSENNIDDIDGTFACFYFDTDHNKLLLFRNELTQLYFDFDKNVSTEEFKGSVTFKPNVFYDFFSGQSVGTFKTFKNPYYMGEDE